MSWFKVDDKLHDHRKVTAAGVEAMGLWVLAGSWCAANPDTDGFIPVRVISRFTRGWVRVGSKLTQAGLWVNSEFKGEQGFQFLHWAEYQFTASDKAKDRDAARDRMRNLRADRKASSEDVRPNSSDVLDPVPVPLPIPKLRPDAAAPDLPRDDVEEICRHLADRIEGNGSKRPEITKSWRTEARRMIDLDGRTVEQILRAIDWSQQNLFWRSNILSVPKLREKYDQLRLAAEAERLRPANQLSTPGPDGIVRAATGRPVRGPGWEES